MFMVALFTFFWCGCSKSESFLHKLQTTSRLASSTDALLWCIVHSWSKLDGPCALLCIIVCRYFRDRASYMQIWAVRVKLLVCNTTHCCKPDCCSVNRCSLCFFSCSNFSEYDIPSFACAKPTPVPRRSFIKALAISLMLFFLLILVF